MKARRVALFALTTVFGTAIFSTARGEGGFHFPIGITYSQGAQDGIDDVANAYQADWSAKYGVNVTVDKINIPLGLTFNPYYEWSCGFGAGLDIGPTLFMAGTLKETTYRFGGESSSSEDTRFTYIIPLGASIRYTFLRDQKISPYVRAGVRYPLAGGDNVSSSEPGPFGAVGVEFWRGHRVGLAVEVGYDGASVQIDSVKGSKRDTFAGFTAGISVLF